MRQIEARANDAEAERDAMRVLSSEVHRFNETVLRLEVCRDERDALRAALLSLVDGKSEFDIEYDTGMPADEARKIMGAQWQERMHEV